MTFYGSIAAGAWTNWLRFELDPNHSPDPGTGFTLDFWILAGYLKTLWTSIQFYGSIAAGVCTIWLRLNRIRIRMRILDPDIIQNCKVDSAKSNGRVSMKFYEWIACESRKTAFNFGSDRLRIIFGMRYPYPDFTQIIDYGGFWRNLVQRWRLRQERAE